MPKNVRTSTKAAAARTKPAETPLDDGLIRSLAGILKETDLSEIEIERKDFRIRVAREISVAAHVAVAPPSSPAAAVAASPPPAPVAAATAPQKGTVTSPMVGTAYLAPAPDKPPFVSIGSKVRRGQTLLIIEAMKTFNEIPATHDGTVTAILIESGHPVEFGEPLLVVE